MAQYLQEVINVIGLLLARMKKYNVLFIWMSLCLFACLSACLFVCLSVCLFVSVCLSVRPFACLSDCLSVSVYLSVYMSSRAVTIHLHLFHVQYLL